MQFVTNTRTSCYNGVPFCCITNYKNWLATLQPPNHSLTSKQKVQYNEVEAKLDLCFWTDFGPNKPVKFHILTNNWKSTSGNKSKNNIF